MKKNIVLLFLLCLFTISNALYAETSISFEIDGVSNEAETNIDIYLSALEVPKQADDDGYLAEVKKSTQDALTVFGYYQPQISVTVNGDEKTPVVLINIEVGPLTYITESSIRLSGAGKSASIFLKLLDTFTLSVGDPLIHTNYESAKSSLKSLARRYGYFDAKFEKAQVDVLSLNNSASVYLWFNTGPRYQFGELVFTSELPAEKFVKSLINFKVGDPFDTRILSDFNADLSETGYFKGITILPEFSEKNGLQVPLHVIASMRPQDSFNAGFGYSTDEGIRGKFRWLRPWVNQYGHSIEGNVVASIPKQEASLTYTIPLEDPIYNYMSVQAGYKMLDQNDTDTTQFLVGLNRHWRLNNRWIRTLFVRYEYENGVQGQQNFDSSLILPGISFSRKRANGGINATWGDNIMTSFEISNKLWASSDDLMKLYGQTKLMRTYSGHQFIGFVELGAIQADSIYNVPSSMRFFTGGDQSVRGFDYESIAPQDSDGYLLGGKYLTVGSLEYRFPIAKSWKLALFSDAGTATNDFSEELSASVGTGIVWASPVGPIRLYFAKPISNAVNDYSIHFMIGPEL